MNCRYKKIIQGKKNTLLWCIFFLFSFITWQQAQGQCYVTATTPANTSWHGAPNGTVTAPAATGTVATLTTNPSGLATGTVITIKARLITYLLGTTTLHVSSSMSSSGPFSAVTDINITSTTLTDYTYTLTSDAKYLKISYTSSNIYTYPVIDAFSFACPQWSCTGYAVGAGASYVGHPVATVALGASDANAVTLASGLALYLDLGETTTAGTVVTIHIKLTAAATLSYAVGNAPGISATDPSYTASGSSLLNLSLAPITTTCTLSANARYLRIKTSGTTYIDAISFTCSPPPPTCAIPAATVSLTPPTCSGSTALANGTITLSAMDANAKKVGYIAGSTYSGGPDFASAQTISGSTFTVANNLPNPGSSQDYTVRIFCDATTYFDKVVTIIPNQCLGYTYSVDNGPYQSANVFSCVYPGTHLVTVKDPTGCISSPTSITINPPSGSVTPTATLVNPSCAAPSSGSITITTPLGANYSYSIDGGEYQASPIFSGLGVSTYSISAKDNTGGCLASAQFTLTTSGVTPPALTVTPASCSNANTIVTVTSPVPGAGIAYALYNWHDNTYGIYQASNIFNIVYNETDSYDFSVVVNENGCITMGTQRIYPNPQPKTPLAPTANVSQPTCSVNTGSITVSLNAAETMPGSSILYSIDGVNYQVSNVFSNVAPGTYNVTLKNRIEGCVSTATSVTINPALTPPIAAVFDIIQPSCASSTGTITITSPLGANFAYSIDGINYSNITGLFENIATGSYSITVKNTSNTCVSVAATAVINAAPVFPTTPTGTPTQPTCTVNTGSITVTSPLGADITYSLDGTTFQASTVFNGLVAETYNIVAKNTTSGCVANSADIVINPPLTVPFTPVASAMHPTCSIATGSITISAPLGAGLSYSIDGITYTNTTGVFTGVTPGTYSVTVKNADGCVSASISIIVNPQPITPATPVATVSNPVCPNTTGTITVTSPVGAGLIYNIDGTQFFGSNTTGIFTGVIGGTYTLNVMSPTGNCASPSITVTVNTPPCAGFDLALKKTLHPEQLSTVTTGDKVYFVINVINQGNAKATNVQITDYIPTGLTLSDPNWTDTGGKATLNTPIATIEIGETIPLLIAFTAGSFNGVVTNFAEISSATGGIDIDSTPDNDPNNDGTVQDNVITGIRKINPSDDEDDHDPASITITSSVACTTFGTLTATTTPASLATGSSSVLDVTGMGITAGTTTFSWAGTGGFTSAIKTPSTGTLATAGGYSYTVTVTNSNGTGICTATATTSLTVSTTPPSCTMDATVTQSACNNNGTPTTIPKTIADDYFDITVAISNGTGNFEVVLNGIVIGSGAYGTSIVISGVGSRFKADGTSTYTLTIRDQANPTCKIDKTTTAVAHCSTACPPQLCPIIVGVKN
jgi:uncharacterized repeat protein (TIGR01451 family)